MLNQTRRQFVKSASAAFAGAAIIPVRLNSSAVETQLASPLVEFGYDRVQLNSELHEKQLQNSISVLMALSEDSLLKPMRQMGGQAAPGEQLG